MLTKHVCQTCVDEHASMKQVNEEWVDADEERWKKGCVLCVLDSGTLLDIMEDAPPVGCRYNLEQLFARDEAIQVPS